MARVIITLQIMPESPEVNLDFIKEKSEPLVRRFARLEPDDELRFEKVPVAFGLVALKIMFLMEENIGSTEKLEDQLKQINGVQSAETTDVRRAIG